MWGCVPEEEVHPSFQAVIADGISEQSLVRRGAPGEAGKR